MSAYRHVVYADFEAAWESVLRPWFTARAATAWEQTLPVVVTCPHGALVALLKQRLLEERIPALGIHFTSPGSLRRLLTPLLGEAPSIALREDLHLLARLAAEEAGDEPVARSVAADSSALIRALDTLEAGGWDASQLPLPEAARLGKRVQSLLLQCGLESVRRVDWRLRAASPTASPRLGDWLALGFSSAEWPEFALLQAAYTVSENAMLCFLAEGERPSSAAWAGAWEEIAGPVEAFLAAAPEAERPFASVADSFAAHREGQAPEVECIVASRQSTEARAVLRRAQSAFTPESGGRMGIVVPPGGTGPAREIAHLLAESGLPHQDRIGYHPAKAPAHRLYSCWANYQGSQSLRYLLPFAQCLREVNKLPPSHYERLEDGAQSCFFELMTGQLAPLQALDKQRAEQNERNAGVLDRFLATWPLLPQAVDLKIFAAVALEQLGRLSWPEDLESLTERLMRLGSAFAGKEISRAAFLQWLSAVADIPGRSRAENAREPFAPWQLLTLREAAGQPWDCLLLAGMSQGDWPPELPESPFLPQETLRSLNAKALRQGSQGEGHLVVINGRSLMPVKADEALRMEDGIAQLLGAVTRKVTLTLALRDPASPSRSRAASEWFLRLHAAARGNWPSPRKLSEQAALTEAKYAQESLPERFEEIEKAFHARRNPQTPFDVYSYSVETVPPGGLLLSASAWGRLFKHPVSTWYDQILRAAPPFDPAHEEPSRRARGTWLHRWLNPAEEGKNGWQTLPKPDLWKTRVQERAIALRGQARAAFEAAGRSLPEWWLADWAASLTLAVQFAESVGTQMQGRQAIGEWNLERSVYHLNAALPSAPLRGRMDLVLADRTPQPEDAAAPLPGYLTVVDFKTGKDKPLAVKDLLKGEGLQLALYALALRDFVGIDTGAIMMTADAPCEPQMFTSDLDDETLEPLWQAMATVIREGRLGDWPSSGYGHQEPRPLAELSVADDILRTKWALTHPGITPS